jgi:hypothetical protein
MALVLFVLLILVGASIVVGRRHSWLLPFVLLCGPLQLSADVGVGVNVSALWMLCVIVLGCVVLLPRLDIRQLAPFERLFVVFVFWCLLEAFRCDDFLMASRVLLKFSFPVLILFLGHFVAPSDRDCERTLKWLAIVCAIVMAAAGGITYYALRPVALIAMSHVFVGYAVLADYCAVMAGLVLVAWATFGKRRYLALFLLVAITPVAYGIRTGIVAASVAIAAFGIAVFRARALPIVAAVYVLACLALFAIPSMRDYMFFDPSRTDALEIMQKPHEIEVDNINTNGRFEMWAWALKEFWEPHPLIGSGTGASQEELYAEGPGGVRVVHSSYVRLLCDVGLIGLTLYALAVISCMLHANGLWRKSPSPVARWCALAVLCAFPAVLACMAFDNMFDYGLAAGQYPYAFAGLMLAAHRRAARRNRGRRQRRAIDRPRPGAEREEDRCVLNRR